MVGACGSNIVAFNLALKTLNFFFFNAEFGKYGASTCILSLTLKKIAFS